MSRSKKLRAVLFGPQGCGKGTQGELLGDRFNVPLIGSGDLFRAEIAKHTALGRLAGKYVEAGALTPDELVNGIMGNQLKKLDLTHGFILDGYPRSVDQAHFLHRLLAPNVAIFIRVTDKVALERLLHRQQCEKCRAVFSVGRGGAAPTPHAGTCSICGGALARRSDDTEKVIRTRLEAYHFMTEPLSRFYREKGILLQVNGEQNIEYVFEDLVKKLAKLGFVA